MALAFKDLQSIEQVRGLIVKAKQAQKIFANFTQEQIDQVISTMALSAQKEVEKLAKLASEETGFGNYSDKVIKNKFASEVVYEHIKDIKTVGILKEDIEKQVMEVAVPLGVISALIPSTNPTSTVIYKALIALKAGNAIIFSPHPMAAKSIIEAVSIMKKAAIQAGAPEGIIGCITIPTKEATDELMSHHDVALTLATGGEAMVRAAYSSGTPAIGVGPGNAPAFIEKSADIPLAVKRIIDSKTFDNGVICASEQAVVVEEELKEAIVEEFKKQGAYFLSKEESEKLSHFILRDNGTMNPAIVGKSPQVVANLVGLSIPIRTRVLISEQTTVGKHNPYSREKLTPILAFYTEKTLEEALARCTELLMNEGKGHTFVLHSNNEDIIKRCALTQPVSRMVVNSPGALGGIGASTNLIPALTLGCGAIGGGSTSDNIGPLHLMNIRAIARGVVELEDSKE
ncbi:acetaldehyde dehydrogenase (acetylating) [Bacillus manliponensis]|uniref:acetaldehyde dehydrogenase (acetylating) n=1 Tax=Bacillus manliponensis TaxID=574376 RepID=UPI00068C0EAC|nr:acetaldehyde dehydrogenase (acetylating) [Bacillus manliponensis]